MYIDIWVLVVLILLAFPTVLFFLIYLIAGIHDLFFVKYYEDKKQEAPYFIEKDFPTEHK